MDILKYANARGPRGHLAGTSARKIRRRDSGVGRPRDRQDFPVRKSSTHVRLRAFTCIRNATGTRVCVRACVLRREGYVVFMLLQCRSRLWPGFFVSRVSLSVVLPPFLFSSSLVTPYFPRSPSKFCSFSQKTRERENERERERERDVADLEIAAETTRRIIARRRGAIRGENNFDATEKCLSFALGKQNGIFYSSSCNTAIRAIKASIPDLIFRNQTHARR